MRILQVCTKAIFPERDGGSIAMYAMADGLSRAGAKVDVISLNIDKLYVKEEDIPEQVRSRFMMKLVDISISASFGKAILSILKGKNYQISRFYSDAMARQLIRQLSACTYDVVVLETLFVAVYLPLIRKYSRAKVVLRAHNVEADIWQLLSKNAAGFHKRVFFGMLSARLRKYEVTIAQTVDAVFCLSEADARWFKAVKARAVSVVPLSVDVPPAPADSRINDTPVFFHLASMEWLPHQQAVDWFLKEVWPLLNNGQGFKKVCFAGRNMPLPFYAFKNEVLEIEGEVTNPKEWMNGKSVMIVPSFTGSGVRVKSIEGLAMGKVIITTPNGTEGIPYVNGVNMFVVNTAKEFAAVMKRLNDDPALCSQVAEAARKLAKEEFDRNAVGFKTKKLLEELLTR